MVFLSPGILAGRAGSDLTGTFPVGHIFSVHVELSP